MQTVSPEFVKALNGSIRPVVQVDLWRGGRQVAANLPFTGGQVTIKAGASIRSSVSVTFTDGDADAFPAGSLVPRRPEDPLHPLGGGILNIQAGLNLGQRIELVSLGWFVIVDADPGWEEWRYYDRAGAPPVATPVAGSVTVNAVDLALKVQDDRFLSVEQPSSATVSSEIARILRGVVGWEAPPGMPVRGVPGDITYEADRLDAWSKLANAVDMDPIFRPDGVATLQPRTEGAPVWRVDPGPKGNLVRFARKASRTGFYNGVVASGATEPEKLPLRSTATLNEGASRWDGNLGRIPLFYNSPFNTTQARTDSSAATRLANYVENQTQEVRLSTVWNPALEVGDTIELVAPSGRLLPTRVVEATWPLIPSDDDPMTLRGAVSPKALAEV